MTLMMVERHYDDEALIALMEAGREQSDAHLPSCTVCRDKLDSFSMIADTLHDRDVWDTRPLHYAPVPATIATLRAFADRMTAEDTAAETILAELLVGSREEWMPRLREHPEWRTAGVVRGLIAATNRAIDTMPPDAVALTGLATDIADHLDVANHLSDTVHRLRGAAWRERAYALFYTGDFAQAERAVERAEGAFRECGVAEYDQARVGIVRALVMRPLERFNEGVLAASSSSETFLRFGDVRRTASSRMAEVHMLAARSEYGRAVAILEELEQHLRHDDDADAYARVVANLGYCTWKAGRRDVAIRHYEAASALYEVLGTRTEAARNRWNVAAVLAEAGRRADALPRLRNVVAELDGLSMSSEAALASLDLAELLLGDSRFEEIDDICRSAMRSFERSGVAYTERALIALAYIGEAAKQKVATRPLVRQVKDYIRRLPNEPHLLFAHAPS